MRKSKVNPEVEFSEAKWVVSILNTNGSLIAGHSAIVVEGLDKDPDSLYVKPFIGQYDIAAKAEFEQDSKINIQGEISKIKCFENEQNTRDYEQKKSPAKSYHVTQLQAKRMIASIKADARRTEQAMENQVRKGRGEQPLHFDEHGEPIKALVYQKLDKSHPLIFLFSHSEEGINCAGWCIEKLGVAGIDLSGALPKPKYIAGQCTIL